jgi:hypothetical protein
MVILAGNIFLIYHLCVLGLVYTVDLRLLVNNGNKERQEFHQLNYRAEIIDAHIRNIEVLRFRAEQQVQQAQDFFKNKHNIDPDQAPTELKRLQEIIRQKEFEINAKTARVSKITCKQGNILLDYPTQKLLAQTPRQKADGQIIRKNEQTARNNQ